MVAGIEFRQLSAQGQIMDSEQLGKTAAGLDRVATGVINDQPEFPPMIAPVQQAQEALEFPLRHGAALHDHAMSGLGIKRASEHATVVAPGHPPARSAATLAAPIWARSGPSMVVARPILLRRQRYPCIALYMLFRDWLMSRAAMPGRMPVVISITAPGFV